MRSDSNPEVAALQLERWARMSPAERLRSALEASEVARGLTLAGLAAKHPAWSEDELRREVLRLTLLPARLPATST